MSADDADRPACSADAGADEASARGSRSDAAPGADDGLARSADAVADAGLARGDDGIVRCAWGDSAPEYRPYHDREWGRPVADDRRLFEKLCLEGFQAGLSWLTILRKREAFRRAFGDFDFGAIASYGPQDVERLLADATIVRHRGKIEAAVWNAGRAVELVETEGSIAAYLWRFEPVPSARPARITWDVVRQLAQTPESRALAKDLKRRGWRFVGPTTAYAFMQAVGIVDDHLEGCAARAAVEGERAAFARPEDAAGRRQRARAQPAPGVMR